MLESLGSYVGGGVHIGVYVLPDSGELTMNQRGHDADDGEVSDDVVSLIAPAAHGRDGVVVVPARPHGAAERERGQVGRGVVAVRSVLPERAYGRHDYGRRELRYLGVSDAERVHVAGAGGFRLLRRRGRLGVGIRRVRRRSRRPASRRACWCCSARSRGCRWGRDGSGRTVRRRPRRIARGRLYLHHVGAHVAEQFAAPRAELAANLQDPQSRYGASR